MQRRDVLLVIAIVISALVLGSCAAGPPAARADAPAVEPEDATDGGAPAVGTEGRVARRAAWWRDPEVTSTLGLSDDQLERIQAVMKADSDQRTTERKRERHAIMAYLRALSQDPYDPALVERRSAELTEVFTSIQRHRVDDVHAVRDILTHEQWMKLWDVAPQALQLGRFKVSLGPTIAVTDEAPVAGDDAATDGGTGDPAENP